MDELTFVDEHGVEVFVRRWTPASSGRAAVVIVHGASEHSGRYARVAELLAGEGYAVYALDLRGHGRTGASTGPGRIGAGGLEGVLADVGTVVGTARSEVADRPVVLLGHSLGSVVALAFIERHGNQIDACVLSGTMGPSDAAEELASGVRQAADAGMADEPLNALGTFNEGIESPRTTYDWLSRDPDEVDKYVADPYCGDDNPLTYGFVAAMLETLVEVAKPERITGVPKSVPVLLLTGDADPVSNSAEQVHAIEKRLREAGLEVTAKYYPGARHEVFNETNRDEVHQDLLRWLTRVT